jgi:hypothetical protein
VTRVAAAGLEAHFEEIEGDEVQLTASISDLDGRGQFVQEGTVSFGSGNALSFHTLGTGESARSPDPHLKHGTASWAVDGGTGQFEGARGRINSNFFLSDTLDLTDNQLGVIFIYGDQSSGDAIDSEVLT